MSRRDYRPMPENAAVAYDKCIDSLESEEFENSWYSVYRSIKYIESGKRQHDKDPDAIQIFPYQTGGDAIFGIGLVGMYIGHDNNEVFMLHFDIGQTGRLAIGGLLTRVDLHVGDNITLSKTFTEHLYDIYGVYEMAVKNNTVIDPDDNNKR